MVAVRGRLSWSRGAGWRLGLGTAGELARPQAVIVIPCVTYTYQPVLQQVSGGYRLSGEGRHSVLQSAAPSLPTRSMWRSSAGTAQDGPRGREPSVPQSRHLVPRRLGLVGWSRRIQGTGPLLRPRSAQTSMAERRIALPSSPLLRCPVAVGPSARDHPPQLIPPHEAPFLRSSGRGPLHVERRRRRAVRLPALTSEVGMGVLSGSVRLATGRKSMSLEA